MNDWNEMNEWMNKGKNGMNEWMNKINEWLEWNEGRNEGLNKGKNKWIK